MAWLEFIKFSIAGLPPGLISIVLLSFIVTLLQLLAYKKFSDQKRIKELKERQKELNREVRQAAKDKDEDKLRKLNKEAMEVNMEMMKLNFKPMLITLLPLLLVFWLLRQSYNAAGIGNIIAWPWNLPIVGNGAGWLLSYIIFSLIFSILLRKIFKIY